MAYSLTGEVGADAAGRIEKLAAAAEKLTIAPPSGIDWSGPVDDSTWHMPEEFISLAGTPLYEAMDERARKRLSMHEASTSLGTGIWFENLLINALARHAYNLRSDDPLFRFLMIEIEEECRHSRMFAEYVKRTGTPPYRPSWWLMLQGKYYWLTGTRTVFYLSILGTEHALDAMTECAWRGPGTNPILRELMRFHTIEEQRHIVFAREYLRAAFPRLGPLGRWYARLYVPVIIYTVIQASVDPAVYRTLGIPDGWSAAWNNPRRRERVKKSLGPYAGFCREIGMLTPLTAPLWHALGLV